jgi:hypothetical protein
MTDVESVSTMTVLVLVIILFLTRRGLGHLDQMIKRRTFRSPRRPQPEKGYRKERRSWTGASTMSTARMSRAERSAIRFAHLLPAGHRQRYEDEWLSELQDFKDQGATRRDRADYVFGVAVSVLRLRWELRGMPAATSSSSTDPSSSTSASALRQEAFTELLQLRAARSTAGDAVTANGWEARFLGGNKVHLRRVADSSRSLEP